MKLVSALIILFIPGLVCSQNSNFFKEQERIQKNKVKKVSMYSVEFENGKNATDSTRSWNRLYDRSGIPSKQYSYSNNDSTLTFFEFLKKSMLLVTTQFDVKDSISSKTVLQFDSLGNKTRSSDYDPRAKLIKYREYEPLTKENLLFGTSYWPNGESDRTRIDLLDETGKVIEMTYYSRQNPNEVWSTIKINYNDAGLIENELVYIEKTLKFQRNYYYSYYK